MPWKTGRYLPARFSFHSLLFGDATSEYMRRFIFLDVDNESKLRVQRVLQAGGLSYPVLVAGLSLVPNYWVRAAVFF